jgi:two-component system CheB/CheR fusion protein
MIESKQIKKNSKIISDQENRIIALKNLATYYKEITETVREPFIILDKDLRVVTANKSFYAKFKTLKKNTEGRRIYEIGNNQWDAPELRVLLEHILPKHRLLNNYEVTHDFPDLGVRTMLLNARQVDAKQLILLAIEDVTELRKHRRDSDELTANLIMQRDQLKGLGDAKDEFVSLASHQLRTPATAIKQYVGMLNDGYAGKLSKDQRDMLNVVYESNERQLEIIEHLLRVARVDDGKVYLEKSPCDVMKQVKAVIKDQAVMFKSRRQNVVIIKPEREVIAFIDPKLMLMVLGNLLDNAGKYSQPGEQVTINIQQSHGFTIIAVKDNGVGIKKIDRQKLFKKFSRIDSNLSEPVKGTGLGLYWAQKILGLHGGSIEVSSVSNKGSTFTVKLPITAENLQS